VTPATPTSAAYIPDGYLSIGCDHFVILLSLLTISPPGLSNLSPRK
jgi:hypothetical protein